MHKGIWAIVLGFCVWGAALATELPEGELVVTLANGTVVGVGELEEGGLELDLLAGTRGFVTFTVTAEDGTVVSFEVAVGEDGSLTVVESFEDLAGSIAAAGGEVDVAFEEAEEFQANATAEGAEHATGLDRADERANENAAEGLARARANRDRDATAEDDVEDVEEQEDADEAAEAAEEAAEQAAEEAEEAAERAAEASEEDGETPEDEAHDDEDEEDEEEQDDDGDDAADSRTANRGGQPQDD